MLNESKSVESISEVPKVAKYLQLEDAINDMEAIKIHLNEFHTQVVGTNQIQTLKESEVARSSPMSLVLLLETAPKCIRTTIEECHEIINEIQKIILQ